jgi:hypothetical protein
MHRDDKSAFYRGSLGYEVTFIGRRMAIVIVMSFRPEEYFQRRRNERHPDQRLRSSRRTIVAIIQVTGAPGGSELGAQFNSCKDWSHLQRMIHNSVGTVSISVIGGPSQP